MAPRNVTTRRNKQKHKFVDDLEDRILQPQTLTSRRPVAWEEDEDGELIPVFSIEYAYTEKDLEPYKKYPRLYRERMYIERPVSSVAL